MTREEAINNLNMIGVAFVDPVTKEQRKLIDDTFDLAIKALEQEPSNDMVSRGVFEQVMWERDVAIDQLKDLGYGFAEKPRTGHWIDRSEVGRIKYPWMESHECSECGENGSAAWDYCPNCGADMREARRYYGKE